MSMYYFRTVRLFGYTWPVAFFTHCIKACNCFSHIALLNAPAKVLVLQKQNQWDNSSLMTLLAHKIFRCKNIKLKS